MGQLSDAHDPYEALRFPDYRRLLVGNVLASLGFDAEAPTVANGSAICIGSCSGTWRKQDMSTD